MAEYVKVASAADIPEGTLKGFEIGPHRFVIVHAAGGFCAVVDECTHESVPLSEGEISDGQIVCRAHGARFDPKSGAVTAPPAVVPVETLEVKVEGDSIYVALED